MRRLRLFLLLAVLAVIGFAFLEARADPIVRRARLALPNWPAGAAPVRVALVSDLHLGNWSTDEARLSRIADQISAEHPDLILIAGDMVAGANRSEAARLPAPLSRLHARLGVVAVLGNHDWGTGPALVRAGLARAGVTVLQNEAIVRGPLAIGGLDDEPTGHARPAQVRAALAALPGARVVMGHGPDNAPDFPRDLFLAGHTHCGQVVLPIIGAPIMMSRYGEHYRCGLIRERYRMVVIGAGTGTSNLPFRFGAPPDWWLLTLGPR